MKNIRNYLALAVAARDQSGVGLMHQWAEILALRLGESQLGVSEYYSYRLFERRLSDEDRRQFAGYRRERLVDRALNKDYWRAVANDKLVFYAALRGLGFPYPRVRAVCHPLGRFFPEAIYIRTADELRRFLHEASYPIFLKPIHGSFGRGACSAQAFDAAQDALLLGNGKPWSLQEAAAAMLAPATAGYVVQDLVQPHAVIREFCRATASSVRMVVVYGSRGPQVFRCAWKIPVGRNMSDNFMHGASGNLLAAVDPVSGRVQRVITGPGLGLREVEKHPETGQALRDMVLPNWPQMRDVCLTAATCFPGLRLQNWDIAIGEAGPIILEVNVEGSMDLHQLAGGRGILDETLRDALVAAAAPRSSRT